MNFQGFLDNLSHGHPRIEGGVRVLEDGLYLSPIILDFRRLHGAHIFSAEKDLSLRGFQEFEDTPSHRRFSAPGFSHEPQRLTLVNMERHPVHSLDPAHRLSENTSLNRKKLLEGLYLQQVLCLRV